MNRNEQPNTLLIFVVSILVLILIVLLLWPSGNSDNSISTNGTEVENIVIPKTNVALLVGDTYNINVIVSPSTAINKAVTYVSNNPSVASVDDNGLVKANGIGDTTIIVRSNNGKEAICTISVSKKSTPITSIKLSKDDIVLVEGESTTLTVKTNPSNATEHNFTWTSSNPTVATVSNGKITANKVGTTLITVKTSSGKVAICDVEVKAKTVAVSSVSLNASSKTIKVGETFNLIATVTPSDAANKSIIWTSSNPAVATVSGGIVRGISSGTTTITASSNNGKKATCTIKIEHLYIITEDSKYNSYSTVANYNSSTLKYKIINANGQDVVLIWASDPINQMNGALASPNAKGTASAESMLNSVLTSVGSNKGLVAVNASFFSSGSPWGGVVLNKGKIVKNEGVSAGVIGIDSSGKLKIYNKETATSLQSKGIRNTFVISSQTRIDNSGEIANRTQICQLDNNNFAILSGSGTVKGCGNQLMNLTGCTDAFNLDGGGSRKLYYKNGGSLTRRFGGDRQLPDMLYFIEK